MSKWPELLRGEISADEAGPLLSDGVSRLSELLKSQPLTEQRVLNILQRHIGGGKNAETWEVMLSGLQCYLGDDLTSLVAWIAQDSGRADRLTRLEAYGAPEVMSFLRTILAVHGTDFERAYAVWNELPDNWESMSREVFHDQISGTQRIVLRVRKFSGEEVSFEGPRASILNMASTIITGLHVAHDPKAYGEVLIDQFLSDISEFVKLLGKSNELIGLLNPDPIPTGKAKTGKKRKT